jgi:hypothetical protein
MNPPARVRVLGLNRSVLTSRPTRNDQRLLCTEKTISSLLSSETEP